MVQFGGVDTGTVATLDDLIEVATVAAPQPWAYRQMERTLFKHDLLAFIFAFCITEVVLFFRTGLRLG